jgi:peptidyl-prolyl cis-trans isomerase A (cyclophilin A)
MRSTSHDARRGLALFPGFAFGRAITGLTVAVHLVFVAGSLSAATGCKKNEGASTSAATAAIKAAPKPSLERPETLSEKAPDLFRAKFATSKGDFVIEVHRDWAPQGADRFFNLVKTGYYNDTRFFRVISGFMAQIGIHGKPELNAIWREQRIPDDPVTKSNLRSFVTFATGGPNTRTTQFFINFADSNARLDSMGFAPFGQVVSGMNVVDALYADYGEGAPQGRGPSQNRLQTEGNAYLARDFPQLDFVKEATVLP